MRLWWLFICLILAISSAEKFSETFTRKGTVVKDKAQGAARHTVASGLKGAAAAIDT